MPTDVGPDLCPSTRMTCGVLVGVPVTVSGIQAHGYR